MGSIKRGTNGGWGVGGPQTLCPQSGLELLINRMVIAFLPLRFRRLFHFVNYQYSHTYLRSEASSELFRVSNGLRYFGILLKLIFIKYLNEKLYRDC